MTISKTTGLAGCILCVLAGNLLAETAGSPPFSPMSPMGGSNKAQAPNYLGASIGSTTTNGFCDGLSACENSDKSWKAFAGVRMNENIVLESGYVDFGKQAGVDASGGNVSQQATAFTAAAVAGIPMNEQIELFGKAGMARWTAEQTDRTGVTESKGTDVLVGAGANYDLGDNMGIRAEWERFKDIGSKAGQDGDIDLMSLGFIFSSL